MGRLSMPMADTQKMYRCSLCPGGGAAPQKPLKPASFLMDFAPFGKIPPTGKDVVEEGMS